jgi:hypothetical protein
MHRTFLAPCLLLSAAACSVRTGGDDTSRYAVEDMTPSYVATSNGEHVEVRAQLFAHGSGASPLRLGSDDRFRVTLGGVEIPLVADGDVYVGRAAQPVHAANADVSNLLDVQFLRPKTSAEVATAAVFLPEPFSIVSVAGTWNATDDLVVHTTGIVSLPQTTYVADFDGRCLEHGHASTDVVVGGSGDVYIEPSKLPFDPDPECELEVALRVVRAGTVDQRFAASFSVEGGGGLHAVQERHFTVRVEPEPEPER